MLANMTQEQTNQHNTETCKSIAQELENIANGILYRCTGCGDTINIEDYTDDEDLYEAIEFGNYCNCPECGDEEMFEQVSMFDWLEDALDFDFIVDRNKEYKACRILVAFGGPNIYVDTMRGSVDLYWWGDRASYPLSTTACAELDTTMEDYYNCY